MATTNSGTEVEALKEDMKAVRKDIVALTQALSNEARGSLNRAAHSVSDSAHAASQAAQQAGREGVAAVSRQVETHPVTSLLTAAGVGFMLGLLLRRA